MNATWLLCIACGERAQMCRTCSPTADGKKVFFCPRCGCVSCRRAWDRQHGRFMPMLARKIFAGWFLVMPAGKDSLAGAIHVTPAMNDVALWKELRATGQLGAARKLEHLIVGDLLAGVYD